LLKYAFEYFENNINEVVTKTKGMPNLSEAKKKAKIEDDLSKIRDKVLNLKLIYTALDNDDDAYIIFETLNTRGKDLTLSDLVKGHLARLLKPANGGVDLTKDKWNKIQKTFEESSAELEVSTFIHHFWLSRYEYITEKKLYKALRKRITKENAGAFLDDLVKESEIYRYIHEPSYKKWKKEECEIRDSLAAMNIFRIKQQLPLVLSVMRHYEDQSLKTKNVREILEAIEDFHFSFTAIVSQRSSGGISFMYALTARELYKAKNLESKIKVLQDFNKKKLQAKRPTYAEFEPNFTTLMYSSKMTKQKNLVRYILMKIYRKNTIGLTPDPALVTIEHLASENPAKKTVLTQEQIASIGNLILINKELNGELANKSFPEKVKILSDAHVWIDPVILAANDWGSVEIKKRTALLAKDAYENVWKF
jgi:hypothetical protein